MSDRRAGSVVIKYNTESPKQGSKRLLRRRSNLPIWVYFFLYNMYIVVGWGNFLYRIQHFFAQQLQCEHKNVFHLLFANDGEANVVRIYRQNQNSYKKFQQNFLNCIYNIVYCLSYEMILLYNVYICLKTSTLMHMVCLL